MSRHRRPSWSPQPEWLPHSGSKRSRRSKSRYKLAVLALAVAMLTIGLFAGRPAPTEAAWLDHEYGTSTLTAVTAVPTPIVASCFLDIAILGAITKVTMIWSFAVPTDYTAANTQFYSSTTPIPAGATVSPMSTPPTTSQPVPNGPFHSVFEGPLLAGILGGNLYLYVQAKAGSWVSARVGVRVTYGLIGIGTTCSGL